MISPLQLNDFSIGQVHLTPGSLPISEHHSIAVQASPTFGRKNDDPRQWLVRLNVTFKGAPGVAAAYEGSVEGIAHFTVNDPEMDEEKQQLLVAVNGTSIVYSSLRQFIASITAQSTNGKMILPSLSFANRRLAGRQLKMPTQQEIDHLLAEARSDPDRIIDFRPTDKGMQLFTNKRPVKNSEGGPAWAFVMKDLVDAGTLVEVVPGLKWKLAETGP
jgi:preprotein translocase subunit SecB